MLTKQFNKNPILAAMEYTAGNLKIYFKKGQIRVYGAVPAPIAYGLFYKTNAADTLQYYSTQIKGSFTVTQVINH
jgi:hypothetical protein